MTVNAITTQPQHLVDAINKSIEEKSLKTWRKALNTKDEILYSHTPEQWDGKALMKPYVEKDKVEFRVSWWNQNGEPADDVKGYILGRFVEALMVHFKNHFTHLEIRK